MTTKLEQFPKWYESLQQIPKGSDPASDKMYGVTYDEIVKAVTFAAESKGLSPKQFIVNNLAAAFEAENEAERRQKQDEDAQAHLKRTEQRIRALNKQINRCNGIVNGISTLNKLIDDIHSDHSVADLAKSQFVADREAAALFLRCIAEDARTLRSAAVTERTSLRHKRLDLLKDKRVLYGY